MIKVAVFFGLGIGCHKEVAYAYKLAGAEVDLFHINELLSAKVNLDNYQILNLAGGFLYGDLLGSGMCTANELNLASYAGERLKDKLLAFADSGRVIYGQCNGFQLLVKSGLLPGVDDDYSYQQVTLSHNDCGSYRVDFVAHTLESEHFAFAGLENQIFHLWCRHGEGRFSTWNETASVSKDTGDAILEKIKSDHVLLRYCDETNAGRARSFPSNPNGSIDAIAGLKNSNGYIFGHMAHPEVSVFTSRSPGWFAYKDELRRKEHSREEFDHPDLGSVIFGNIVGIFR